MVSDCDHKCLVVNLFGAPGTGKSTGAAYVFSCLKMLGVNVELVTEFAKDAVWEENRKAFNEDAQAYLFGCQMWRMLRCQDDVDVIVTDSPLLLSIPYNRSELLGEQFNSLVSKVFKSYNNISYMIHRAGRYETNGRVHTEEESGELHWKIVECLEREHIPYKNIDGDLSGYHSIVVDIMNAIHGESA